MVSYMKPFLHYTRQIFAAAISGIPEFLEFLKVSGFKKVSYGNNYKKEDCVGKVPGILLFSCNES